MAIIDVWIQLEYQAWDACPRRPIDRATAEGVLPVGPLKQVILRSPVTERTRTAIVNVPLPGGALILRRYTEGWRTPNDRKVNPWDLNEPSPTDYGTMGTIPGPTIECNVGDTVRVHFRNLDFREAFSAPPWERGHDVPDLPVELRTHSLHAHGFVFAREHDGAYPLTPPDRNQPIEYSELTNWNFVGVKRFKRGDRVPPGGTFTYTWDARWPTSAGVWFYHDHSINHHENTARGAIGMIVIHNPDDVENEVEINDARLPGGSWTLTPIRRRCFWPEHVKIMPYALERLGVDDMMADSGGAGHAEEAERVTTLPGDFEEAAHEPEGGGEMHTLSGDRVIRWGDFSVELTENYSDVNKICFDVYRDPPDQARYLLLFHEMPGVGMCINGRKYLGNAPTLVAGPKTRMRFGVVGMGDAFHTFHIHGHRWVIPGPAGVKHADIETSPQVQSTTQFEDAKVFGPASAFAFTLEEGKGMLRADPPIGEWHMHCHVDHHMMEGMVGSLLVVNGGEMAIPLPIGKAPPLPPRPPEAKPTDPQPAAYRPTTHEVQIYDGPGHFAPLNLSITAGDTVRWTNISRDRHTVSGHSNLWPVSKWGSDAAQPGHTIGAGESWSTTFPYPTQVAYRCRLHPDSIGTIMIAPKPSSAGAAPAPGAGATTHQVAITSTGFSPGSITIKVGDTVNWTNQDTSVHTATSDDHSWATPTLTTGKSFSRTFTSAGSIPYHCHIHHEMTATVQVNP